MENCQVSKDGQRNAALEGENRWQQWYTMVALRSWEICVRRGDELVLWLGRLGRAPLAGSAGPAWQPWCSGLPTLVSGCQLSASSHPRRGRPRPLQSFPEGTSGGCQASTSFYWSRRVTACPQWRVGRQVAKKMWPFQITGDNKNGMKEKYEEDLIKEIHSFHINSFIWL